MAVSESKVILPDITVPFGVANGVPVYFSPEWYQALQRLAELANATKDEVDTQHP